MIPIDLALAVVLLPMSVGTGLVAHELGHALVLRAAGVPHDVIWFGGRDSDALGAAGAGRWATVRPRPSRETPAWVLRASAMAPLAMVAPFALVPLGVVPAPFAGSLTVQAVLLGWTACAIPSPQDFSVLWYAGRALDDHVGEDDSARPELGATGE
jgi:Zn-dependent protease